MKILTDNQGALFIAHNPIEHCRLKHVALDLHFIREHTEQENLIVQYVSGTEQWADILTKALASATFSRQQPNLVGEPPRD